MPPSIPHSCLYVEWAREKEPPAMTPPLECLGGGWGCRRDKRSPKRQVATLDQTSSLLPCGSKKQVQETMFLNVPLNFNLELSTFNNLNCEAWKTQERLESNPPPLVRTFWMHFKHLIRALTTTILMAKLYWIFCMRPARCWEHCRGFGILSSPLPSEAGAIIILNLRLPRLPYKSMPTPHSGVIIQWQCKNKLSLSLG